MPENADENIIIKFIVKADEALLETINYRKEVDALKIKLRELAEETGRSVKSVAAEMREGFRADALGRLEDGAEGAREEMRRFGAVSRTAVSELSTEMRQSDMGTRTFMDRLGRLGDVGRFVFGTVLGIGAVEALRRIIGLFKEAGESLIAFRRNIFLLEVGVRALQRSGFDTTISEWVDQIDDFKKRFPIFPTAEIVDAFDKAILKLREYNFTQEETIKLLEIAALLSRITGRDFGEMSDRITGAITRGWFEALQNLGIPLSRLEIMQEAYNQSLDKSFNLLDESTRAHLAYQLLLENVGDITEDAAIITEESFDRISIANAKIADSQLELGRSSENLVVMWRESWANILGATAVAIGQIEELLGRLEKKNAEVELFLLRTARAFLQWQLATGAISASEPQIEASVQFFDEQIQIVEERMEKLSMTAEETADSIVEEFMRLGDLPPTIRVPVIVGGIEFTAEEFQNIIRATQDLVDEIDKIDEEAKEKNAEIWADWSKDRTDIWEDHLEKLADLESDLVGKLADIDLKEQRKISDEVADNAFRVAEAIRKSNFRRQDAERKFREREISEERKFQEKMRQLRENFLLDLEDAVRERDARQIIRLTRQFNLRRDQMMREEKLDKEDRQGAFQEELRQIEQQKQERLRQLAIENKRRLADIARQAERERAQAQLDFKRRRDDEKARVLEEQSERNTRRDEQLKDLEDATQERINVLIQSLQKEFELSQEQLDAVSSLYEGAYGPDGRIDKSLVWYQQRLLQTEALVQRLNLFINSMTPLPKLTGSQPGDELDFAGGQAEGGTIIAKKPTVAIFGEAGPEMATFTPLNKLGSQSESRMTPMDVGMSKDGRIRLELLLSPDLEGRIIDNTLGEMADINFAIERARK